MFDINNWAPSSVLQQATGQRCWSSGQLSHLAHVRVSAINSRHYPGLGSAASVVLSSCFSRFKFLFFPMTW